MADGGKRGGRKVSKDSTSDRYGDKDKRKGKEGKSETRNLLRLRRARAHRSELSTQMDQQF